MLRRYSMILQFFLGPRKYRAVWFLCWGIFGLMFILFLLKVFYKLYYFPRHPSSFRYYTEVPPKETTNEFDVLRDTDPGPPLTGCQHECWGDAEKVACEPRGRKYEVCTARCYGYLYTTCTSSPLTDWLYAFVAN